MTDTNVDPHEEEEIEAGWEHVTPELLDHLVIEHDDAMNDHYCFMGEGNPFESTTTTTITPTKETI